MSRIIRNMLTGLAGRGKCLLLQAFGVALAGALTPTFALAAEHATYTYCISHADEPGCSPSSAVAAGNEWLHYGGDQANTRYSALKQINTSNVKNLRVAWIHSLGSLESQESTPLVVGDTMYVTTLHRAEVRLRARRQDRQDEVEARAGDAQRLLRDGVLRPGQPRRRLRQRQDLLRPAGRQAGGARRQHRQGAVDGDGGRLQDRATPSPRRRWSTRTWW